MVGEQRAQGGVPKQETFGDQERVQSEWVEMGGKLGLSSLGAPVAPPP